MAGYPKSGTTWASRLISDLADCPLVGDWGYETSENQSNYSEGNGRISNYRCFKSHCTFEELSKFEYQEIHKIIYIIRDPRDIVISGANYFYFSIPFITVFMRFFRRYKLERKVNMFYHRKIATNTKYEQMIQSILNGGSNVNIWMKSPWIKHYQSYLNRNILVLKYEDLLKNPITECDKILSYLNITKAIGNINASIKRQSFAIRQKEQIHNNNSYTNRLLREGSSEYWKTALTQKQKYLFSLSLNSDNEYYDFSVKNKDL